MNSIVAKFKLDSHHKIERFGISVLIFALLFIFVTFITFAHSLKATGVNYDTQSVYTRNFTMSKSETSADIYDVSVSDSRDKAFVLVKFSDMSNMSTDPKDYQMFVTGVDPRGGQTALESNPHGAVYMYGSSGYVGFYLSDPNGLPSQIMEITIRQGSELVINNNPKLSKDLAGDGSFIAHDQGRFYINPGASDASISNVLSADVINPVDLFGEMVIEREEQIVHQTLYQKLDEMRVALNRIDEAERAVASETVGGVSVIIPERPEAIAGDKIDWDEDAEGKIIYPEDLIRKNITNTYNTNDPNIVVSHYNDTLRLDTDYTVAKGYNFNWHDMPAVTGYDKALGGDTVSYALEKTKEDIKLTDTFNIDTTEWKMSDGSILGDYSGNNMDSANRIVNGVVRVVDEYRSYAKLKENYQVDLMNNLVRLDLMYKDISENHSINSNETALIRW